MSFLCFFKNLLRRLPKLMKWWWTVVSSKPFQDRTSSHMWAPIGLTRRILLWDTSPSWGANLLPCTVTVVSCFFMVLSPIFLCTSYHERSLGQYSLLFQPRPYQLIEVYSEMFIPCCCRGRQCTLPNGYLPRSIGRYPRYVSKNAWQCFAERHKVVSIPVALLWRSQIALRRKLALGAILCLSIFTVIVCIIRAVGSDISSGQVDLPWLNLWLQIEAGIAVIIVSVTAYRSLFVGRNSYDQGDGPNRGTPSHQWTCSRSKLELSRLPKIPLRVFTGVRRFTRGPDRTNRHGKSTTPSDGDQYLPHDLPLLPRHQVSLQEVSEGHLGLAPRSDRYPQSSWNLEIANEICYIVRGERSDRVLSSSLNFWWISQGYDIVS